MTVVLINPLFKTVTAVGHCHCEHLVSLHCTSICIVFSFSLLPTLKLVGETRFIVIICNIIR